MRKQPTFFLPLSILVVAVIGLVFMLTTSALTNAQDVKVKMVPIVYTDPDNGQEMYIKYCAPCHGVKGDGKGPAAPAFKHAPTDLTTLTKNHGGKYPTHLVLATITIGAPTQAHGSVHMPVWGDAFRHLDSGHSAATSLRITNLIEYIKTLQAK